MTHIAILIPVFNGLEYTKSCLTKLKPELEEAKNENTSYSIIIIDDGSTDGTSDWLAENHADLVILKGDGNLWWSGGINKGVEFVLENNIADYTLWWNNDIGTDQNYFATLTKIIETIDKDVIIGSKIYDMQSGLIWGMGGTFNTKTGNYDQLANMVEDSNKHQTTLSVDWLPGMGTLIPVNAYKKVGLLDELNFPQYHGDLDYTLRCKLSGFTINVFPSLKLYNDTSNSGFKKKETFKDIIASLKSQRSLYNVKRDIALYKKFTKTPFSYYQLLIKYSKYLGGFLKWKMLATVGLKRQ